MGERGCAIAIELKKIFMDEWTGVVDPHYASELFAALAGTVPVVESELAATRARLRWLQPVLKANA